MLITLGQTSPAASRGLTNSKVFLRSLISSATIGSIVLTLGEKPEVARQAACRYECASIFLVFLSEVLWLLLRALDS